MMGKDVILFVCHYLNDAVLQGFHDLEEECGETIDCILYYDNTRKDLKDPGIKSLRTFSMKEIKKLGYKVENLWYDSHYCVLNFYAKNPGYRYYWRIDHDVRYMGKWMDFFSLFESRDEDFLATYIQRYTESVTDPFSDGPWFCWNLIKKIKVPDSAKVKCFFPLLRFSNRALLKLHDCFSSGIHGFSEIIVSTLLDMYGYKIGDIGKELYDKECFRFKGIPVEKPGKLIHPVKC
ncbi:MAG: DUF3405 domain-containing protein [Spirochaetales bacterium]|nr:DUF3405 domain-containing protein [Spirochaetales bacterium]